MLLLRSDDTVRAVYKEHDMTEAEKLNAPVPSLSDPIFLVVYSEREAAALRSLINAIDQSLIEAISERYGKVLAGLICAEIMDPKRGVCLYSPGNGFRPPPTLIVARED